MRVPNWESALAEYIDQRRHVPFAWGLNDCLTFANGASAVISITGRGFADRYLGYRSLRGARTHYASVLEAFGTESGIKLMDELLPRSTNKMSRGAIIARKTPVFCTGYALGVCIGPKIAFVGADGLEFGRPDNDDIAWAVL